MDLINNVDIGLRYYVKYEIYRILKMYSYLFFSLAFLFYLTNNILPYDIIRSLILFVYFSIVPIPLLYSFIFYVLLKTKDPSYKFEIDTRLISKVSFLIFLFIFTPSIFILLVTILLPPSDPFTVFSPFGATFQYFFYYEFIPEHIELIPIGIILIYNYFLLRKLSNNKSGHIFLFTGIFSCIYFFIEKFYLFVIWGDFLHLGSNISFIKGIYENFWLIYIIIGIIFYVVSINFLKRDISEQRTNR